MHSLPLAPEHPRISETTARKLDPSCRDCPRGQVAADRSWPVCAKPEGRPDGILVVGGHPGARGGRPFGAGHWMGWRREIEAVLAPRRIPVAWDNATRCAIAPDEKDNVGPEAERACSAHARHVLGQTMPERVFLVGREAQRTWLGWSLDATKCRRARTWLADGTPVFLFADPPFASNKILAKWLREDMEWALDVDPGRPPPVRITNVWSGGDMQALVDACRDVDVALDAETYGRTHDPDYELVCVSLGMWQPDGSVLVWSIDGDDLRAEPAWRQLLGEAIRVAKRLIGHNLKADLEFLAAADIEAKPRRMFDTQFALKVVDSYRDGSLGDLSAIVGMGGHKGEMHRALKRAVAMLKKLRGYRDAEVVESTKVVEKISEKTGKRMRRTVPDVKRPPTPAEQREQVIAAWSKPRTIEGVSTTIGDFMRAPQITARWLNAALSNSDPWGYVYGLVDGELCARYNAMDTGATLLLVPVADDREFATVLRKLPHIERLPEAVGKIERAGMMFDLAAHDIAAAHISAERDAALAQIHEYAPGINPASDDQVRALLFDELGLPPQKKTKKSGNWGVDSKVTLKALRAMHPVVPALIKFAEVDKLHSSYGENLRLFVQSDGRIHPSYNIVGAESGRFSCHDPNLQQVPTRTKAGKLIKRCFIAPPGRVLVSLDYKALEMYVAAFLSKDPVLVAAFREGLDPHRANAIAASLMVWGTPFDDCGLGYTLDTPGITAEQRQALLDAQETRRDIAKTVGFGAIYGQGPAALAEQKGISLEAAKAAQRAVLGRLKGLAAWIEETKKAARRDGFTRTWWADGGWARRRSLPDLASANDGERGHAERAAVNNWVQGGGGEYCSASIVKLIPELEWQYPTARVIVTVHDQIGLECDEEDAEGVAKLGIEVMTDHRTAHEVPLRVDAQIGRNWGDMQKLGDWLKAAA